MILSLAREQSDVCANTGDGVTLEWPTPDVGQVWSGTLVWTTVMDQPNSSRPQATAQAFVGPNIGGSALGSAGQISGLYVPSGLALSLVVSNLVKGDQLQAVFYGQQGDSAEVDVPATILAQGANATLAPTIPTAPSSWNRVVQSSAVTPTTIAGPGPTRGSWLYLFTVYATPINVGAPPVVNGGSQLIDRDGNLIMEYQHAFAITNNIQPLVIPWQGIPVGQDPSLTNRPRLDVINLAGGDNYVWNIAFTLV